MRFPADTRAVTFPPGLDDPAVPGRFAVGLSDVTAPVTLTIRGNVLTMLPAGFASPYGSHVDTLDMSSSVQLVAIDVGAFSGLSSLTVLNFDGSFHLSRISDGWLQGLSRLHTIDLSDCAIAVVSNGTFQGAVNLTSVNLARNPITSMATGPFETQHNLQPSGVQLTGAVLICSPQRPSTSSPTLPMCVSCSTASGNSQTTFVSHNGIVQCVAPVPVANLSNVHQVLPSYSTNNFLTWGERTQWAIGRTYRIQGVNYTAVVLESGRTVDGHVLFSLQNAPPGLFIDVNTAEMLFSPRATAAATVNVDRNPPRLSRCGHCCTHRL